MKPHGKPNMTGAYTPASMGKASNMTGAHPKNSSGKSQGTGPERSGDPKGGSLQGGKAGNHAAMRKPYK